ncbi:MAG: hypothetical protein ACHP65_02240 [Legionellales bacterium]
MTIDLWHFPRTELAQQVLGLFENGLSSALVFFAPRRMGKTEFLLKDIQPLAKKKGFETLYFSFLDSGATSQPNFTNTLMLFADKAGLQRAKKGSLSRIRKIAADVAGVGGGVLEFDAAKDQPVDMISLFASLSNHGKILLLLDEVQVLTQHDSNHLFIAGLRTALDMHKDSIKVIFTGSSREGLRRMFSHASAPFFHFGQNLPFPELTRQFTDHLSSVYKKITKNTLDPDSLWGAFQEMDNVPQLARSLVERLALNPNLSITTAKEQLLNDIFNDRAYIEVWDKASKLEQMLLNEIALGTESLFSEANRQQFAKRLGIKVLAVSSTQSALRVLQRKLLVGRSPDRAGYFIDDPNFKRWLLNNE